MKSNLPSSKIYRTNKIKSDGFFHTHPNSMFAYSYYELNTGYL